MPRAFGSMHHFVEIISGSSFNGGPQRLFFDVFSRRCREHPFKLQLLRDFKVIRQKQSSSKADIHFSRVRISSYSSTLRNGKCLTALLLDNIYLLYYITQVGEER